MNTIINTKVPDFSVNAFVDGEFKTISNKDLAGKWTILFFYPADFTFVCPTELVDMADHYDQFKALGAEVYSVSTDSEFTHKAWHDTSDSIKKVKFPMLADKTGALSEALGVLNPATFLAYRGSFIINPEGEIKVLEINDNGIGRNADELLRKLEAAQFVAEHGDQVCPARWKPGAATLKPGIELVGKI
ncbi:MAG: peroxiredoxin [Bacteroidales bacterium]|nr:peroxiredoxin [Bacteroidales bacterium]